MHFKKVNLSSQQNAYLRLLNELLYFFLIKFQFYQKKLIYFHVKVWIVFFFILDRKEIFENYLVILSCLLTLFFIWGTEPLAELTNLIVLIKIKKSKIINSIKNLK